MRFLSKIILILFLLNTMIFAQVSYDRFFLDKTMRIDYYHTGNLDNEIFSIDQVYEEPFWGGSKVNLIDTLNLGKYMVKVFDVVTNRMIYSRGYCTIFGEWQTTLEAKEKYQTFQESVVFPFPKNSVQVVIAARDERNYFIDKFSTVIDPESRFVNREKKPDHEFITIMDNGTPETKVDIVILAEGYTKTEQSKFSADVNKFVKELFKVPPFKERKKDFNVRAIPLISKDSGIDEPRKNIWKDTALGASYNSLDSPRYILSLQNKRIRDTASNVPYDQIYILINSNRYGGGGIYNWFSTCITGSEKESQAWWPIYVFVHEFGHAFGGLGDEYYSTGVAGSEFYLPGVEPWEPNITALVDTSKIKWGNFIEKGTPIPTPWAKVKYDSLTNLIGKLDPDSADYNTKYENLYNDMTLLLKSDTYANKVGCFEGAGYAAIGLYRPAVDCRMFSKSLTNFCPVCKATIEKVIDFYSK